MDRAATRIERLAEALVDLTAITLGRIVLAMEHVDLAHLALDAVDMTPGASTHVVRFTPSREPARVFVDPMRIRRVISELIENAARCSAVSSEIDVTLTVVGRQACISVSDHGIGIPSDARSHIFEPFFRAHVGTANDVGGIGIGLFLSREIITRHGGTITFENDERNGTTFTVCLPLDKEAS